MPDLTDIRLIWLKGWLFLLMGILSGAILIATFADLQATVLLVITVWAFCRFYYFAFYVIEHYVEPSHRFAGPFAFAQYALRQFPRYGYRMICHKLRQLGWHINFKRVYRIWRQEGLKVPMTRVKNADLATAPTRPSDGVPNASTMFEAGILFLIGRQHASN